MNGDLSILWFHPNCGGYSLTNLNPGPIKRSMTGIQINDTYGSMFGVDQLCECQINDELRVGDEVLLKTDSGPLSFNVVLIESYFDESGQPCEVMGVGLDGPESEWVMPGDTLRISGPDDNVDAGRTATSFLHVPVDDRHQVEIHRQLMHSGRP